ncbi:MAG: hypothetical protein HY908_16350 [Myxococcales bacterium]|nr:hypothetical protein [Myxococcales bacterium]
MAASLGASNAAPPVASRPAAAVAAPSPPTPPASVTPASIAPSGRPYHSHQAVRVSVVPVPNQPDILLARLLRQNEQAPPGAREALLIALEPDGPLVE